MANYYNSDQVAMFPSTYRNREWNSKYTSERNFVNIINSVVDAEDGYVLSTEKSIQDDHEPLRIVLHGYYFEITFEDTNWLNNSTNLYVAIRVENKLQGSHALVAFGSGAADEKTIDGNNIFYGLTWSNTYIDGLENSEDYTYYQLHVAKDGTLLHKARLSSNSIYFDNETSDSQRTVTDLLNSKQNNLVSGNGITISPNSEISLIDTYNSVLTSMTPSVGNVGGDEHPVFVEHVGTTYTVKPISANSGLPKTSGASGSTNYTYTQAALITSGVLTQNGVAFYASEGYPLDNVGKPGDFWFKYSNTNN